MTNAAEDKSVGLKHSMRSARWKRVAQVALKAKLASIRILRRKLGFRGM